MKQTVPDFVLSLVTSFFQPLVWESLFTGALAVSICKDKFSEENRLLCSTWRPSEIFFLRTSTNFPFSPTLCSAPRGKDAENWGDWSLLCPFYINIYTALMQWQYISEAIVKAKIVPRQNDSHGPTSQWLENALSLTLRSWVTSLPLLAWAFLGQWLFA